MFGCMTQLNINLTPDFEKDLKNYMKEKGCSQKSEAVRLALHEAVERLKGQKIKTNYKVWRGIALMVSQNPKPRFKNDDNLWN